MKAEDVIALARRELNDAEPGNYRWPDDVLLAHLNRALVRLNQDRPDLLLTEAGAMTAFAEAAATTDTLVYGATARTALVHHVCFSALSEDSDNAANAKRAANYQTQYAYDIGRK